MYGKTLFINGKLHYGSLAWTEISNEMNNVVKPYSLYLIVSQNRFNILNNLKKNFFPQETSYDDCENSNPKYESNTESSTTSDYETDSDTELKKNIVLDLDIPYDTYFKMKPINVQYGKGNKKRNYSGIKPGTWTDFIFEEMYKKFKLPCSFIFKRCKIYPTSDSTFLKIFGKCKDKNCKVICMVSLIRNL